MRRVGCAHDSWATTGLCDLQLKSDVPERARVAHVSVQDHRRYRYRYRRGPSAGDVLTGILILGTIGAVIDANLGTLTMLAGNNLAINASPTNATTAAPPPNMRSQLRAVDAPYPALTRYRCRRRRARARHE